MRHFLGVVGLIALGIGTNVSVRAMIAWLDRPAQASPTPRIASEGPRLESSEPGHTVEVPRDLALSALKQSGRPLAADRDATTRGTRSVRIDRVLTSTGSVSLAGRADLFDRDAPAVYVWVVRVRDVTERELRFEWFDRENPFQVPPGRVQTVSFEEVLPLDIAPGDYIIELSVHNVDEAPKISELGAARRPITLE